MAVDACAIIAADKSVGSGRAISGSSQNSQTAQIDKTRQNASIQFKNGINSVHEMYLSTRKTGRTLTTPTMSNPVGASHSEPALHPHVDIGSLHPLRNPLINAELRPMSLAVISPNARITEFCHNSNLQDPFFAKIYLPYTALTGYRDGQIRTAEGRGYLCLHFNGNDPRIFGLAGFNAPDLVHNHDVTGSATQPLSQAASTQNNTTSTSRPLAQPAAQRGFPVNTLSTHGPISAQTSTFHATFTTPASVEIPERPQQPPLPADSQISPTPALFFQDRTSGLDDAVLFGSTPKGQADLPDNHDTRQYSPAEWLFLTHVVRYFKGIDDLHRGLVIPQEFRQGEYLEGIGDDGTVSLRLPVLESLFLRASRTWPTSVFNIFAPKSAAPTLYSSNSEACNHLEAPTGYTFIHDGRHRRTLIYGRRLDVSSNPTSSP